ncbi:MAG: hypothetical protein HY801_00010 [Candidatus Lindowbacteria bacterium]|nr:hypothetical protein [Candidatus Lindowbacteria bacterium]
MPADIRRLKRHILRNELLDRELDFLPSTISRDDVREVARKYGPQRRRLPLVRMAVSAADFVVRYGAPVAGMLLGAEYRTAQVLTPLVGPEQRVGDSLRILLGQNLGRQLEDTNRTLQIAGALPDIVSYTFYGALIGLVAYYTLKWLLVLNVSYRRRVKLTRKIAEVLG